MQKLEKIFSEKDRLVETVAQLKENLADVKVDKMALLLEKKSEDSLIKLAEKFNEVLTNNTLKIEEKMDRSLKHLSDKLCEVDSSLKKHNEAYKLHEWEKNIINYSKKKIIALKSKKRQRKKLNPSQQIFLKC